MKQVNFNHDALKPDPYYSEVHATFGDRLCAAREGAGLTQNMLASKMGVRVKTIQAWESDSVEPRANKLQMVSALLNVSMVWLMSGLGTGIEPPGDAINSSDSENLEMLQELKNIRSVCEGLLTQLVTLEKKLLKKIEKK